MPERCAYVRDFCAGAELRRFVMVAAATAFVCGLFVFRRFGGGGLGFFLAIKRGFGRAAALARGFFFRGVVAAMAVFMFAHGGSPC